ncbi:hypothetical protein E3P94_04042 [Wallemia ichthyophaga]|nr:hypothetical protein E3P95_04047 [Wallemia ichthyophaga]TIA95474.1 hypothetical protein E3P94_04042 [Wallemia ichthyophaga]
MTDLIKQLPTHDGTGTFSNGDDLDLCSFTPTSFDSSLPSNLSDDSDKSPQSKLVSDVVSRRRKSSAASLCSSCQQHQSQLSSSIFAQSAGLYKKTSVDCTHIEPPPSNIVSYLASYLVLTLKSLHLI